MVLSPTERMALVEKLLQGYAEKGVFQAFARLENQRGQANFLLVWHQRQHFALTFRPANDSLRFACVLPQLPSTSVMYREFKTWLASKQNLALPEHRRCDPLRLEIKPYNRGGQVALNVRSLDGDLVYATRQLIGLVHAIYLEFLSSGLYFEWLVETFELDPDNPRPS